MFNRIVNKILLPLLIFLVFSVSVTIIFVLYDIRAKFTTTIEDKMNSTLKELEAKLNLIDDYVKNQVRAGMNYLKKESFSNGVANIKGRIDFAAKEIPNLRFGNKEVTNDFNLVDGVQKIVGGTATIFVKSGEEYIRITTNVKKSDGSRAIGTILDPKGKAIKSINQSKPFYGYVTILEKPYITGYEPIFNDKNQVIGIFYVGYPLASLSSIGEQIISTKLFNSGFVALIDDKENVVYCSNNFKPEQVKEILKENYNNNTLTIKEILSNKWNYKLIAAVPNSEINDMTFASVKSTLISNILIFTIVTISLAIFLQIIIVRPIKHINNSTQKYIGGDKSVKIQLKTKDELGHLGNTIDKMIETIETNFKELEKKEKIAKENYEQNLKLKLISEERNRMLEKNISVLLNTMEKFSEGYLDVSVNNDVNDDHINKLFEGFNITVLRIKELVSNIISLVNKTADSTSLIASNAEEMAAGSQELSSQVHEIASSIEEMSSTILQTTRNTNRTAENSKIAVETAISGGKVINDTIESIEKIAEVVTLASENIKGLGENSKQIGEIVQVINEIAEQTNLLALNAAIEAARAGEQGRGFAVVADEVRKLAERTAKATKEIASMIKKIQSDTANTIHSVNAGNKEIEEGKKLAEKAKNSLKNIINKTNEVVDLANQVAAASEEQSATIEQISRNIENMSNVTNESAKGIQEVARAVDDLNKLTDSLKDTVRIFKLDDMTTTDRISFKLKV